MYLSKGNLSKCPARNAKDANNIAPCEENLCLTGDFQCFVRTKNPLPQTKLVNILKT